MKPGIRHAAFLPAQKDFLKLMRCIGRNVRCFVWFIPLMLTYTPSLAAPIEPGRLFYTPAQRAQLETARTLTTAVSGTDSAPLNAPPQVRYDGMVIRSDGTRTNWINGQQQSGPSGVAGLKPGQIRADGRIYEPYQVLRPQPESGTAKEPSP